MPLVDALLLDPLLTNVWIALRTDGVPGTGTQNDPYDGSDFDGVMNRLGAYTRVCLGPGTFQTSGYSDDVGGGWQARAGMKIVGSGIDVTIIQLAGTSADGHFYAIGHPLMVSGSPNLCDFFEVSDLTIDCNLSAYGGSAACGAVRVMGNHARASRVKAIYWGNSDSSRPCFVISMVTADPASGVSGVDDCGIQDCVVLTPDAGTVGPVTLLHVGGIETASENATGVGLGPYIRNCFVDAGLSDPAAVDIRALSVNWCKMAVVEGNQIHNVKYGGPVQRATSAFDMVVRNNIYKNVFRGVFLGAQGATRGGSGMLSRSGSTVTVAMASAHNLQVGDYVLLDMGTSDPYNGLVTTVLTKTSTQFTFLTSLSASSPTVNSVRKVFGVGNLTVEGNVIELAADTAMTQIGIDAEDQAGGSRMQDTSYPTYVFGNLIIRDNKVRYLDGATGGGYPGYGFQINGAQNLLVRNNVVESDPAHPIHNKRCGSVEYFNNLQPDGELIQGWNDDLGIAYEELTTDAEFALVLSVFNKR